MYYYLPYSRLGTNELELGWEGCAQLGFNVQKHWWLMSIHRINLKLKLKSTNSTIYCCSVVWCYFGFIWQNIFVILWIIVTYGLKTIMIQRYTEHCVTVPPAIGWPNVTYYMLNKYLIILTIDLFLCGIHIFVIYFDTFVKI